VVRLFQTILMVLLEFGSLTQLHSCSSPSGLLVVLLLMLETNPGMSAAKRERSGIFLWLTMETHPYLEIKALELLGIFIRITVDRSGQL
jgi:hypothetical protein